MKVSHMFSLESDPYLSAKLFETQHLPPSDPTYAARNLEIPEARQASITLYRAE
jgi:hypothetical protein